MVSHPTTSTDPSQAAKTSFHSETDAERPPTPSNTVLSVADHSTSLSPDSFSFRRIIGTGTFADVYIAEDKRTARPVAVKALLKSQCCTPNSIARVFSEKTILKQVQHANVVRFVGTFQDTQRLYLVMEYAQGGELYSLMRTKGALSRSECQFVAAEVASALDYLHSEGVVYRDLKAENVLISASGHMKLADFGFVKRLKKDERTFTLCGTPHCMSPEILARSGHSFESDWWSLGTLLHEMITGDSPFAGDSPYEMYVKILTHTYAPPKEADNPTASLLAGLLDKDPRTRIRGRDVMTHQFFRGVEWDALELTRPFFVPDVKNDLDDSHFDHYDTFPEEAPTPGLDQTLHGNKVVPDQLIALPQINKNYLYLPNRFVERDLQTCQLGTAGLENSGNTCFINAAIQCISNATPLTDYFLSGVYLEEINVRNVLGTRGELAEAYAELMEAMWFNAHECLLPRRLLDLIYAYANQFSDGNQHDAHEFLACFLDKLHEDLNRSAQKLTQSMSEDREEKDERKAARAWQLYLVKNSSVIVDLFQGQLKSTVTCLTCNHVSTTFDTFMYLSVPVPKIDRPVTLVDCLIEFTKDEILPDKCWVCPKCKCMVRACKKIDIWKVPPLLIIHLKRFYYDQNSYGKLINRVDYPLCGLDITQYISGPQKEPPVYDLFAKTDHEGDMTAGHYVAYAKNSRSHVWHLFDDEAVTEIEELGVMTDMAYLLFYCKVSISQYRRQCSRMPDLWPHIISRKESFGSDTQDQTDSTVSGFEHDTRRQKKRPLRVIKEDPVM